MYCIITNCYYGDEPLKVFLPENVVGAKKLKVGAVLKLELDLPANRIKNLGKPFDGIGHFLTVEFDPSDKFDFDKLAIPNLHVEESSEAESNYAQSKVITD